jgi:hypothetical protein
MAAHKNKEDGTGQEMLTYTKMSRIERIQILKSQRSRD